MALIVSETFLLGLNVVVFVSFRSCRCGDFHLKTLKAPTDTSCSAAAA